MIGIYRFVCWERLTVARLALRRTSMYASLPLRRAPLSLLRAAQARLKRSERGSEAI